MNEYSTIRVRIVDEHRIITFDRPRSLNAFNRTMLAELKDALTKAQRASSRAVLIAGSGRAFSVGQDLAEVAPKKNEGLVDLGEVIEQAYNPLIRTIRALSCPVVCAVNGVAAGAGANLALVCDIVIAARSARFIQAFSKIGLVPDSGGSWTLTHHLGPARALGLAMTGATLPAEQAAEWGLIWKVVDDDTLTAEAERLTAELAAGATLGLALTKRAIRAASGQDLNAQLDLERDLQQRAGRSLDYVEGVTAFIEKRSPRFTGKE